MRDDPCKVLVIDDNRDCADSAVMLLRIWGHDAKAAYEAKTALEVAIDFDPDVVLIDIGLPAKDGFELGKDIQAACPDCRIVALTGFTKEDIVRRSRECGFVDHLTKPADPAVLKEVVDEQCAAGSNQACDS